MDLPTILDVAIGDVFLFAILALLASAAMEAISALFQIRAAQLCRAIEDIISDKALRERFYNTPVVRQLCGATKVGAARKGFSYLPASRFAEGLLWALDEAHGGLAALQAKAAKPGAKLSDIERVALRIHAEAGADAAVVKAELERWFDTVMDRVGGVFKRKTYLWLFLIGVLAAAALNVDLVKVNTQLWVDPATRAAVVKAAVAAAKAPPEVQPCQYEAISGKGQAKPDCIAQWNAIAGQLRPFPLGWEADEIHIGWPIDWRAVLAKLVSFLVVGLSATLGAPFWFDLLQRFVRLRATGPKPGADTTKDAGATRRN
jgi:hypothetical protein